VLSSESGLGKVTDFLCVPRGAIAGRQIYDCIHAGEEGAKRLPGAVIHTGFSFATLSSRGLRSAL
jgi:hypothetical protein